MEKELENYIDYFEDIVEGKIDPIDGRDIWQKTQSPLETRFLEDCRTVGLLVEPQYKIGPIHADFAIPLKKIAIECDSKIHHSSEEARKNDESRNEIYLKHGWNVLRIRGRAIYSCGENIAEDIKNGFYDWGSCDHITRSLLDRDWYEEKNDKNECYLELKKGREWMN